MLFGNLMYGMYCMSWMEMVSGKLFYWPIFYDQPLDGDVFILILIILWGRSMMMMMMMMTWSAVWILLLETSWMNNNWKIT